VKNIEKIILKYSNDKPAKHIDASNTRPDYYISFHLLPSQIIIQTNFALNIFRKNTKTTLIPETAAVPIPTKDRYSENVFQNLDFAQIRNCP